jgi:hypothetical protein
MLACLEPQGVQLANDIFELMEKLTAPTRNRLKELGVSTTCFAPVVDSCRPVLAKR